MVGSVLVLMLVVMILYFSRQGIIVAISVIYAKYVCM